MSIDINIALSPAEQHRVLACFSALFPLRNREKTEHEVATLAQTRLQWESTSIDLFFADIPFHESIAQRTRDVAYIGTRLPIISAEDLIVLKVAFNRPQDWIDIEHMFQIQQQALDTEYIRRWLAEFYQQPDDLPRQKVEALIHDYQPGRG